MVISDDGNYTLYKPYGANRAMGLLNGLDSARKQSQVLIRIDRSLPGGEG